MRVYACGAAAKASATSAEALNRVALLEAQHRDMMRRMQEQIEEAEATREAMLFSSRETEDKLLRNHNVVLFFAIVFCF